LSIEGNIFWGSTKNFFFFILEEKKVSRSIINELNKMELNPIPLKVKGNDNDDQVSEKKEELREDILPVIKRHIKDNIANLSKILCERYPELKWLTGKTHVTPEGIIEDRDKPLSVQLFGEKHIEFDKTLVSIFCLFWLLEGEYDSFVECQQREARLSKESFSNLKKYVEDILIEVGKEIGKGISEGIEALIVFTVLNDLGKVESVVQWVRSKTAIEEVDHDKILEMGLRENPGEFPSYNKLHERIKKWLLEGLQAQFNFAQFVQAENVPNNLKGLAGVSNKALGLFNLHALFDMAGAAGHIKYNGSLTLTDATYKDVMLCVDSTNLVASQKASVVYVYDNYLHERGKSLGLDVRRETERSLLRICCLLRYHTKDQAKAVISAYEKLDVHDWHILRQELCTTGIDDGQAILLYYAPALFLNCQSAMSKPGEPPNAEAIRIGMNAMLECFKCARGHIKNRPGNGHFTADIAEIANIAKDPKKLSKVVCSISAIGEDGKIYGVSKE